MTDMIVLSDPLTWVNDQSPNIVADTDPDVTIDEDQTPTPLEVEEAVEAAEAGDEV